MPCPALPRTSAVIEAGLGSVHVGAQIFVSVRGRVVADAALGLARPDVPMSTTTLLRHLLTHTAGLLPAEQALGPVRYQQSFADNVALICRTPADPTSPPGGRAAYLTTSSMLMIAEVIRRVMPAAHAVHTSRQNETCTAIYEDLGLAA